MLSTIDASRRKCKKKKSKLNIKKQKNIQCRIIKTIFLISRDIKLSILKNKCNYVSQGMREKN